MLLPFWFAVEEMKLVAGFAVVVVIIVVVAVHCNTLRFNQLPEICPLNNLQRVILFDN